MNRERASIRRYAAVATAIAASSLALAACGGTSDKDQITSMIKAYGVTPTKLCTQYASAQMLRDQFGSRDQCLAAASAPNARDPRVKVDSVSVKGDTAVAIRTTGTNPGKGLKAEVDLVKTSHGWKINAVTPIS